MEKEQFLTIARAEGFDKAMEALSRDVRELYDKETLGKFAQCDIDAYDYAEAALILNEIKGDGRWYDYERGSIRCIHNIDEALECYSYTL